ncbi:hypothetical protein K470DRAFT_168910 [Piedraia hortae CBS 480.64]|uniref:Uncharacterized protein n=1 Tax=Piedraia hortae CBS 480.64 TaxID=1314780 RepID=A0A6A7BQU2_9PEZI|nr:hypothetical protein K470DRAFT_168910 [Piedraia hortae CBS 480.64]
MPFLNVFLSAFKAPLHSQPPAVASAASPTPTATAKSAAAAAAANTTTTTESVSSITWSESPRRSSAERGEAGISEQPAAATAPQQIPNSTARKKSSENFPQPPLHHQISWGWPLSTTRRRGSGGSTNSTLTSSSSYSSTGGFREVKGESWYVAGCPFVGGEERVYRLAIARRQKNLDLGDFDRLSL